METNKILDLMKSERDRLNRAINALASADYVETVHAETTTSSASAGPVPPNGARRGGMSQAARAAISAAQKKRWKAFRKQQANQA